MKIISILRHLSSGLVSHDYAIDRTAEWMRDPLSHPDIEAMSERELGDLPFCGSWRRSPTGETCPA